MKNGQKSLRLNFALNAALTLSSFLFPLVTFPYVSRMLLPEGVGKVAFAESLIAYFTLFAQLGIPIYGIRACARVRDDPEALSRTAQELLILNLINGLIAYAALALALVFVPRLREDRALYILMSARITLTAIGMEWLYKALEQYATITARTLAVRVVVLALTFILVRRREDWMLYGAVIVVGSSMVNLFNAIHARRFIALRPVGGYRFRRHLKPLMVFFAMACATTVYLHLDVLMLGFMKADVDVGCYHAAVKVKRLLTGVVTSLGAVLLPRVSYYVERGMAEDFRRLTHKALSFVMLAAAPLTVYFMLYAREGILLISGPAYEGAALPMRVIMPTVLLIGITNVLGLQILVPQGREKVVLASEVAGAATDLMLNALLIPRYAALGATIGTLAAEFVVLLVQLFALKGEIAGAFARIQYGKLAAALLLAALASRAALFINPGNHFAVLAISATLFFGIYGLTLWLMREPLTREITRQATDWMKRRGRRQAGQRRRP